MTFKSITMAALAFALGAGTPVFAQSQTSADLIKALKQDKKPLTRSLSGAPKEAAILKKLKTRQIVVETKQAREEIKKAVVEAKLPSIAIKVNFALASDKILPGSFAALNELGEALQSKELYDTKILLNGHTDATGGDALNQALSERRAHAVKHYLQAKFLVPAHNLLAIGYGEEQLLNAGDPAAAENRRVEIVNLGG